MRTAILRRLAVPVIALACLAGVAGCSDDGGDDADAGTTSTTEATADESTTTADDTTTTGATEPGDDGTTSTSESSGGTTDETPPDTAGQGQEGTGAPDEEAPDVSWDLNAAQYRGQDGKRIAFLCPPDGEIGSVWGTDTYTDDSSVCSAAVHAGLINPVEGGRIVVEIAPGEDSYEGSEANGVTSQDYGSWDGSFVFPRA
jgi:hypothetical protein